MKSTTTFKDFKDLSAIKTTRHPKAFDLDSEDPQLDLETWKSVIVNKAWEGRKKLQPNEMSVRLQMPSAHRKKIKVGPLAIVEATEIYLRFGSKLIKSLGWRKSETIAVFQHPEDKSVYGLMPKPNGRKLRSESRDTGMFYMCFGFLNEEKRLTQNSKVVDFCIHENGYLLFRLPPQEQE